MGQRGERATGPGARHAAVYEGGDSGAHVAAATQGRGWSQRGWAVWEARSALSVFLLLSRIWVVEEVGMLAPVPRKVGLMFTEQASLRGRAHLVDKSQSAASLRAQSLRVSDSLRTPWTVAHQAPLSMGFPRQEY